MKALVCEGYDGIDALKLKDVPCEGADNLQPGQLHVRIHAAGVNFADLLIVAGLYQVKPELPFVPGMEIAGEVIAAGSANNFKPGDRICAVTQMNGFAQEAVIDGASAIALPDGVSFDVGAAFPVAYGTAHLCLEHRARLQSGERLLVHGAAGGVGLAAVDIGKWMGAEVVATASTPEKLALTQSYGASDAILSSDSGLINKLKAGGGCDVAFDPVGGDMFKASLRALNWEGRLLVIGFAGGDIPQAPANIVLVKNLSIIGGFWGSYQTKAPKVLFGSLEKLLGGISAGALKPLVSQTYPLSEAIDAMKSMQARKSTGKLIINPQA